MNVSNEKVTTDIFSLNNNEFDVTVSEREFHELLHKFTSTDFSNFESLCEMLEQINFCASKEEFAYFINFGSEQNESFVVILIDFFRRVSTSDSCETNKFLLLSKVMRIFKKIVFNKYGTVVTINGTGSINNDLHRETLLQKDDTFNCFLLKLVESISKDELRARGDVYEFVKLSFDYMHELVKHCSDFGLYLWCKDLFKMTSEIIVFVEDDNIRDKGSEIMTLFLSKDKNFANAFLCYNLEYHRKLIDIFTFTSLYNCDLFASYVECLKFENLKKNYEISYNPVSDDISELLLKLLDSIRKRILEKTIKDDFIDRILCSLIKIGFINYDLMLRNGIFQFFLDIIKAQANFDLKKRAAKTLSKCLVDLFYNVNGNITQAISTLDHIYSSLNDLSFFVDFLETNDFDIKKTIADIFSICFNVISNVDQPKETVFYKLLINTRALVEFFDDEYNTYDDSEDPCYAEMICLIRNYIMTYENC